jgi:hypothetical protein
MARELSIFLDESGDFGPLSTHSPYYVLGIVLHDQAEDIRRHLDHIHEALRRHGFDNHHAIHTGPLIRREPPYTALTLPERRSLFRVLFDFVRHCPIQHHALVFDKRQLGNRQQLIAAMSRALGSLIRDNDDFFRRQDRVVIYYDNGQQEITGLVNSVFNAHFSNVEVRHVAPGDYTLFQVADLVCTLELLRTKLATGRLTASERGFFSTSKASAERALRLLYLRTMDRKRFPK